MTVDRTLVRLGIVVGAAALTATGCGSGGDDVTGTWAGRCTGLSDSDSQVQLRLAENGQYSSSSTGKDGETAGTYRVVDSVTLNLSNSLRQQVYRYSINNDVLTLETTVENRTQTCNLKRA